MVLFVEVFFSLTRSKWTWELARHDMTQHNICMTHVVVGYGPGWAEDILKYHGTTRLLNWLARDGTKHARPRQT